MNESRTRVSLVKLFRERCSITVLRSGSESGVEHVHVGNGKGPPARVLQAKDGEAYLLDASAETDPYVSVPHYGYSSCYCTTEAYRPYGSKLYGLSLAAEKGHLWCMTELRSAIIESPETHSGSTWTITDEAIQRAYTEALKASMLHGYQECARQALRWGAQIPSEWWQKYNPDQLADWLGQSLVRHTGKLGEYARQQGSSAVPWGEVRRQGDAPAGEYIVKGYYMVESAALEPGELDCMRRERKKVLMVQETQDGIDRRISSAPEHAAAEEYRNAILLASSGDGPSVEVVVHDDGSCRLLRVRQQRA